MRVRMIHVGDHKVADFGRPGVRRDFGRKLGTLRGRKITTRNFLSEAQFSSPCVRRMRPLTDGETKTLFAKLASYIGRNISSLIDRPDDPHVFRLHKDRVYYVSSHLANLATSLPRTNLLSLGTCLGKFSKSGKFRLHVTALDFLAQHATYKVWIKPNGEMPFLYGNHVLKAHVGRITQDTPEHQGVVVYSMSDIPLVTQFDDVV
jgi:60S ribosome subunit biogenesis protein NIP7